MKIEYRVYDSRRGSSHSYTQWTGGRVYRVRFEGITLYTGWYNFDKDRLASGKTLENMLKEAYEEWNETELAKIKLICQEDLAKQMGFDNFPWEESYWGSKEAYVEWENPTVLANQIAKALKDRSYYTEWCKTEAYKNAIEETYSHRAFINGDQVYHKLNGQWYAVQEFLRGKGLRTLDSFENIERFRQQDAENLLAEEKARKEHAQKCGVLARKYGIRFEVSLRNFKGNEAEIASFTSSLKQALVKPYKENELLAGRERRRAEIARLGIDISNVDPNYIAPYILDCLRAGKVLQK